MSTDGTHVLWTLRGAQPVVSADRGASWTLAKGLPAGSKISEYANVDIQPAADRVNASKVYVLEAMGGNVYRSHDGGLSFEQVNVPTLQSKGEWALSTSSIVPVPGHEGHLWITTGDTLQRSTDAAATFVVMKGIEEAYAVGFGKPATGAKYPALYLLGKISGQKGIFRSDDEGATFVRINDDQHQFAGATHIIGDPRVEGRVYVGTGGRGILYGTPR